MSNTNLPKKGVYFGKLMPGHIGHLSQINNASAKVQQLDVIVSEHEEANGALCAEAGIPYISGAQRVEWLKEELKDKPNINVKLLNESNMPIYPNGWDYWTKELQNVAGEPINMFFVGEPEYVTKLNNYFPEAEVVLSDRTVIDISATKIRNNPIKYMDYILPSARPFFAEIKKEINGGM